MAAVLAIGTAAGFGADWPTWRYGAGRSAAAPNELPSQLHLRWVRELPTPVPAWPNEPRLHFDGCYEPVVAGKTVFIGSPNDGSVIALDTETGEEQWRFYTQGPVRFAPIAWQGKLYVASDDGRLYCLDAATAAVQWVFSSVPEGMPDAHHLGNARLVSLWPIRGGPVLADGRLYLGSGIWPSMGVFVHALDAETGKVLWKNETLGFLPKTRVDHNLTADVGCSPQGYLVVAGDKLLVPNGRAMPARLDLETGKLLHYLQGYRNGHYRVTANGRYAFVGKDGVVDLTTGTEVGSRYAQAGDKAPQGLTARYDLFEGPYFRYKFMRGCDAWSVLTEGTAYGVSRGTFYAYDVSRAGVSTYPAKHRENELKPFRWDAPLAWKLPTEYADPDKDKGKNKDDKGEDKGEASGAVIKAGSRLYGHAGKILIAVDLPRSGTKASIAWEKTLEDVPRSLLAADDKLFVVTEKGRIYCYAGQAGEKTKRYSQEIAMLPKTNDGWTSRATRLLETSRVSEGYAVVLGLKTGRLVEELLEQSNLRILAVDSDRETVRRLRDVLVAANLYGSRAEVFLADPLKFVLPPYLASLVVSETLDAADVSAGTTAEAVFEILRPYGGVLCLKSSEDGDSFDRWVAEAGLQKASLSRANGFLLLRRDGPLPGSAPWTHEAANAARTYYSLDERVTAPLGVLWYGDGPDYAFSKSSDYDFGVKPQVVGGRLFALDLRRRELHAVDVYTGRRLWQVDVDRPARFASMEDGIYVAWGNACKILDPATGKQLREFKLHDAAQVGQKCSVADVRVAGDIILVNVTCDEVSGGTPLLLEGTELVALDRTSGNILWAKKAKERFNNHAVVIGGGLVFCVDSMSFTKIQHGKRRGDSPKDTASTLMAIHPRTGEEAWRFVMDYPYQELGYIAPLTLRANDDWLAYSEPCGTLLAGKAETVIAFDPRRGKTVWRKRVDGPQPMVLREDTFIHQHGKVFDIRTGEPVGGESFFRTNVGGYRGCNYGVGGGKLVFLREITAAYVDVGSGRKYHLRNIRTGCSASLIAADGVLTVPNFAVGCVCNYPLQTAFAMVHMPAIERWAKPTAAAENGGPGGSN